MKNAQETARSVTLNLLQDPWRGAPDKPKGSEGPFRGPHCTLAGERWTWEVSCVRTHKRWFPDFPGGTVEKNPLANAGDTGSTP